MLVLYVVAALCPTGTVVVDVDDTHKQSGHKIGGTGSFRDAVRSTKLRTKLIQTRLCQGP